MLNQAEEEILKRLAREHAPRVVTNPNRGNDEVSEGTVERHIQTAFRRAGQGPMVVQGGQLGKTLSPQIEAEPDYGFIDRVRHVMLPNERPLEFVARTGLAAVQARTMTKDQITAFVAQAEANINEEWSPNRRTPWSYTPVAS